MGYDGERFVWENRRVRSTQVCFGEVLYQPGGSCGPRVQRDCQLVFLHSGSLNVLIDGQRRRLAPGHVGLFLPGRTEDFAFSETHPTHHSWCSVAPTLVPGALRRALDGAKVSQTCSEMQARLLASGMTLPAADSELARQAIDHVGLALLAAYAHDSAASVELSVVAKATRYLDEHLFEPDCLQRAHGAAGVSRNTLITRFRQELRTTPARYVWRRRTERGIAMLAETGHTIAEIAYACGFRDPFHFSRLVKGLQGSSPQHLRQQVWNKSEGAPASRARARVGSSKSGKRRSSAR
jgi:AraC-like DNA-binding protein